MADNAIDTILKAINDMQDKINADVDDKLKNYVPMPIFQELECESKGVARRVNHNENSLKGVLETTEANSERIESNRKRLNKLAADIEAMKSGRSSMNMGGIAHEVASADCKSE